MTPSSRSLSLALAFVLGGLTAPLLVPRLSAQPEQPTRQSWEFVCINHNGNTGNELSEGMSRLGARGWELTTTFVVPHTRAGAIVGTDVRSCFKRPR